MVQKKILLIWNILCFFALTSWALPAVSRQQQLPETYETRLAEIQEIKDQEKQEKIQQKAKLKKRYKISYLAHQKNRLLKISNRDGFIWFGDKDNKYTYFLSNFYPSPISIWNMKFSCAESAFQAAKFLHQPEIAVRFTYLEGEKAMKLAEEESYRQRGDWYQVREKIMQEVLEAKFQQHNDLAELLVATGKAYLAEHSTRNVFWTDGKDGSGKNRLGSLLMQIREKKGGCGIVTKPVKN